MQSVLRDAKGIFEDVAVTPKSADDDKSTQGIVKSDENIITKNYNKEAELFINNDVKKLPNITPDMLPTSISGWVQDVCERIESPFEIGAVTALTLIGNLIGNKVGIRPKAKDNWTVVPNVWGMIIGSPSIKKTPVYSELYKAVSKLEIEENENFKAALEEYKLEEELYKAKKKEAVKKTDDNSKVKELIAPMMPNKKRYATSDGTIEAIADIISHNPSGLLITRDELSGFLNMMDKAGKEGDRAFYLEGWNGTGSFSVDRIMRGSTFIPKLTLGILGNIQPSIIKQYVYEAVKGGKADGFLQRFQLTVFVDAIEQKGVDRYPNKEQRDKFYSIVESIAKAEYFTGSQTDEFDDTQFYRFKDDAQAAYNEWFLSNFKDTQNAFNEAFEGHLAKYPSFMASIALIFHVCDIATNKEGKFDYRISKENTLRAIKLVEVFKAHAKRLYSTFEVEEQKRDERADRILSFIGSNTLPITFRNVMQKAGGKPNKDEVLKAIKGIYKTAGSKIVSKI